MYSEIKDAMRSASRSREAAIVVLIAIGLFLIAWAATVILSLGSSRHHSQQEQGGLVHLEPGPL
jgi:uncharacterized membrane protein